MKTVRDIYNFLKYIRLYDYVRDEDDFMVNNPMFAGYVINFKKLSMYRYLVKIKIENVTIHVHKNIKVHFIAFTDVNVMVYFDGDLPLTSDVIDLWLQEHNKKFMDLTFEELDILKFYLEVTRQ